MTDHQQWLDNLQVGDVVACFFQQTNCYATGNVSRLTKTQIIVAWSYGGEERKFNKHGWEIGGSKWYSRQILQLTPEIEHEIKLQKIKYRFQKWIDDKGPNKLTVDQFQKIFEVINEK